MKRRVRGITFLSRTGLTSYQNAVIETMKKAVDKNKYDWKVARIATNGKVDFE